ncbi:hypothetical protein LAZ67_6003057 [Cordylochernes scorpioides]|uniref:Reverse transcriptase n=1 Tax=Cordylochernes scorpioides TaxID=51811 RepID=A0ABY6KM53_9ARAC|nr:hypothetical protein LAZ67_6003057 [Cordylochernes scorpioides]
MQNIDILKRARAPKRAIFTRLSSEFWTEIEKPDFDAEKYRAKYNRIFALFKEISEIDSRYHGLLLEDETITEVKIEEEFEGCENYVQGMFDIENKYLSRCKTAKVRVDGSLVESAANSVVNTESKRTIRLPKVELPKFKGNLEDWLSWWGQFSKINDDETLVDVDKFHYLLQAVVEGSRAQRLVCSYPITEDNYPKVIQALKDRFGDKNLLIEHYIRRLLKLVVSNARKENLPLDEIYDDLTAHLKNLESLGVNTEMAGVFLYPLVESSLPLDIIQVWQRNPAVGYGIKKKERRMEIRAMPAENFEGNSSMRVTGSQLKTPRKTPPTVSNLFGSAFKRKCIFCQRDNHLSSRCFVASRLTPSERDQKIKEAKVCFKCLKGNHLKRKCRADIKCRNCGKDRLDIFCNKIALKQGGNNSFKGENLRFANDGNATCTGVNMSARTCANDILLMTSVAKLKGAKATKESPSINQKFVQGYRRFQEDVLLYKLKRKKIYIHPSNFRNEEIDILIGSDYFWTITDREGRRSRRGPNCRRDQIRMDAYGAISGDLWELDVLGIQDPIEVVSKKKRETELKEHFIKKYKRDEDQRYSVALPWKCERNNIPSNLEIAQRRLEACTSKLRKEKWLLNILLFFQEWEREGLIERIEENRPQKKGHYLPHRPVFKAESRTTPLRPVFDASCRSYNGLSLNDYLEKGPNLLEKIPEILIRFREKGIGVLADIRKAFQMITVQLQDQDFLRFLWWDQTDPMKLTVFRHKRVVFGLNCSPFILGAVIDHHLNSVQGPAAEIAKTMARSFYMDNLVTSLSSQEEVPTIPEYSCQYHGNGKNGLAHIWFDQTNKNEIHVFCDASKSAYAAVAYMRKLLACVLGARLVKSILTALTNSCPVTLWTDSSTVIAWLKRKNEWNVFVRNRVQEIRDTVNNENWKFVYGKFNPADLPSRGCSIVQFVSTNWWEGPKWLKGEKESWPSFEPTIDEEEIIKEKRKTVQAHTTLIVEANRWFLDRRSKYSLNIRIMAWVLRFLDNARRIRTERGNLKVIELERAERKLLKLVQQETFPGKQAPKNGLKTIKSVEGLWRHNQKPIQTPGAALPTNRIGLGKPFEVTGVGPLYLKGGSKTNANNEFPELEEIRVNSFTRKYKILSKLNEELKQRFRKEYLGVARVKTSTGEWLRPVQRLFSLEISSEETPEKASGDRKPLTIKTRSGREVRKPISPKYPPTNWRGGGVKRSGRGGPELVSQLCRADKKKASRRLALDELRELRPSSINDHTSGLRRDRVADISKKGDVSQGWWKRWASRGTAPGCSEAGALNRPGIQEKWQMELEAEAQERIKFEESAKPQPGATIGREASSDPVVLNPKIDIPKYDGTEDPRPWIESLEEIGFLYHRADYIISRYAAMNMIGSAKTWLNLHKISFSSWENFKSRLIEDFAQTPTKKKSR